MCVCLCARAFACDLEISMWIAVTNRAELRAGLPGLVQCLREGHLVLQEAADHPPEVADVLVGGLACLC